MRVPPGELRHYRETHDYLAPGCLCPLLEPLRKKAVYKEASIYVAIGGRYKGEYIAECAEDRCGYLGQSPIYSIDEVPIPLSTFRENTRKEGNPSQELPAARLVSSPINSTSATYHESGLP